MATFLGKEEIEIEFLPEEESEDRRKEIGGSEGPEPKRERVMVRVLPVDIYPELLKLQNDEPSLVAIYAGKFSKDKETQIYTVDREWATRLTPESNEKVVEVGERLNGDFLARWFARQKARVDRIRPGMMDRFMDKAEGK